ncbi:hypothetical protein [Cupriavidus necator]
MPKVTQITAPAQPAVSIDVDRLDRIESASMQLHSLLVAISGEGFKSFQRLADQHQDNLLWLARDLAGELSSLVGSKQ